jgi:hypothetical protein
MGFSYAGKNDPQPGLFKRFPGFLPAGAMMTAAPFATRPREAQQKDHKRESHDAGRDERLPVHD